MHVKDIDHSFPFDPTHGFELEDLLSVTAPANEPDDFAAFWQDLYRRSLAVDPQAARESCAFNAPHHDIEKVTYSILDGYRIGAYLCLPKSGEVDRLVVHGHGYGGRSEPVRGMGPRTALIAPVAPGFHCSAQEGVPLNDAQRHVVHGIKNPQTYILRNCAATLWSAASVLLALFPEHADSLIYCGGSFGGGMGTLILPWDRRFIGASLSVITFCHHPMRLSCPCTGSGRAVIAYFRRDPQVLQRTLAYFDAAFAAKRLTIPVHFEAALFDPAVPPPGQFCAHNVCPSEKRLTICRVGHFREELMNTDEEVRQRQVHLRALDLEF